MASLTMSSRSVDRQAAGRWLALLVASVWLFHGLVNKLLHGEPRHLAIVQAVPGLAGIAGEVVLAMVGVAEILVAAWVLSGVLPRACAVAQTVFLLPMNALELAFAREHLLWPAMLVPVNLLFLSLAWTAAELRAPAAARENRHLLFRLQRHPLPVRAHFDHCLVLCYAFPAELLAPLLPPGLTLDTYDGYGFVAVAMVQTRGLRPAFLPRRLGQDFFLTGYRVFVKFRTPGGPGGRTLRGLHILRSNADRALMVAGGNLLTHYNYRRCGATLAASSRDLSIAVRTPDGEADVDVVAHLEGAAELPAHSPFRTLHDARRFAGPLPYTFDYEPQTHSIVAIRGQRESWSPRLVPVEVRTMSFLDGARFRGVEPILASAFYVQDIPYRWERGVRHPLAGKAPRRRGRFEGMLQIVRFNAPLYALGTLAALVAAAAAIALPVPAWLAALVLSGAAAATFWLAASLAVSHLVYDRSPLSRWTWIEAALGFAPRTWVNLHAGFDESTPAIRALFPGSVGRCFDFFNPAEMTEPSILRARRLALREHAAEPVDFRGLPLADSSVDAALLLLAAHELRRRPSRVALLAELRRALAPGGKIVLAEHLRDAGNFLAFGPGCLHFWSAREWRGNAAAAGLAIERELQITPWIHVFILRRPTC
jgi:SAM-dependent methyltransferase